MSHRSPHANPPDPTRTFRRVALAVILSAAATQVAAEEPQATRMNDLAAMSLEQLTELKIDVVYGASRHRQATSLAPAAVTIVPREDIQRHGHRTLAEILDSVAGFYTTHDRGYSFIGVRGFNRPGDFGSRMLILLDGQRLNDGIYDSAASDTDFPLDVDLIERVEVIRGPGSSLFGTNAFFGVINVITRRGRDLDGAEMAATAGSFDAWSGRVSYGRRYASGLEILVSGTLYESGGQPRLDFPEYVAEGLDGGRARSAFARISYRDFTLQWGYSRRQKDWPTAAYDTVPNWRDPPLSSLDTETFASLRFERALPSGWDLAARLNFDRYRYDGVYPYDYDGDTATRPTVNRDLAAATEGGVEWTMTKALSPAHRLTMGGEWRRDFEVRQRNWDDDPFETYVDSNRLATVAGLFGQIEWSLRRNLLLNAGARFDHHDRNNRAVNPRGALIYEPTATSTFKFVYGEAFRAPSAYESYYRDVAAGTVPPLQPESVRSFEGIWEQRFGPAWRTRCSVFLSHLHQLIDLRIVEVPGRENSWTADTYSFENRGAARTRGVEGEAEHRWSNGARAVGSYTLADTWDSATAEQMDNSPRHLGKLAFTVPVWRQRLHAGLELHAIGPRRTPRGIRVPGTMLAHLTLFAHSLAPGLELSVSCYNLLDRRHAHPVPVDFTYTGPLSGENIAVEAVEQPGRTLRLKLQYRY